MVNCKCQCCVWESREQKKEPTKGARGKTFNLKYIPEKYPEPSIIKQCICRGNPATVPAFRKQSSALHQIHVFKDSEKNRITVSNNRKALNTQISLNTPRIAKKDTII